MFTGPYENTGSVTEFYEPKSDRLLLVENKYTVYWWEGRGCVRTVPCRSAAVRRRRVVRAKAIRPVRGDCIWRGKENVFKYFSVNDWRSRLFDSCRHAL